MKICFPTEQLQGVDSKVFGHFGSAPGFVIFDTETRQVEEITNGDQHHAHGMCQPLKALGGKNVDGIGVAGIGMGALMKLQAAGIKVYRVVEGTVADNVQLVLDGKLAEFSREFTCAGHAAGHGCGHQH